VSVSTSSSYTFIASVTSPDERVRVWIDTHLLLDSWNSLVSLHNYIPHTTSAATTPASTAAGSGGMGLVDLKIEYKQESASLGFALQWCVLRV